MSSLVLFQYSGRNSLGIGIPAQLKTQGMIDGAEYGPYPCRVYDGDGKLKYEITREQLVSRQFQRAFSDFVLEKGKGLYVKR